MFADPATEAWNDSLCDAVKLATAGVTSTLTVGTSEIVAEALFVASATLLAVTVTVCAEEIEAGATYIPPAEIEPTAGEIVQTTPVFAEPETAAVNVAVCDALSNALPGVTDTSTTGNSVMVATADCAGSALLVAVMVTVWTVFSVAGAV